MGADSPLAERRCTNCKQLCQRDALVVKRVVFDTMGDKYRRLKSRTVAWLCPLCLSEDPAWTQRRHEARR